MNDIEKLEYPEIVRRRPGQFIGAVDTPKVIFREVIDNSIDELYRSPQTNLVIINFNQDKYTVQDNGRGIPIHWKPEHNCTATELAVANLYAGSNFSKTEGAQTVGMNGVGVSATNALSTLFVVLSRITKDNFDKSIPGVKSAWETRKSERNQLFYRIEFKRGIKQIEDVISLGEVSETYSFNPDPRANTIVHFIPDSDIFDDVNNCDPPYTNLVYLGVIMQKYYKRKISVIVNGVEFAKAFNPYKFEFAQSIDLFDSDASFEIANNRAKLTNKLINRKVWMYCTFEFDNDISAGSQDGSVNSLEVNTGVHINASKTALNYALQRIFSTDSPNLVKGLKLVSIIVCAETIFDAQTKRRLEEIPGTDSVKLAISLVSSFENIIKKNKVYFQDHIKKIDSFNIMNKQLSSTKFVKQIVNSTAGNKFNSSAIKKLKDCAETNLKVRQQNCELFLVEGDSAGSTLADIRDTRLHAILPLKGRPLNTMSMTTDQMLRNDEMKDIILSIGAGVNGESRIKAVRYSKILVAADADSDGGVISASLLAFFANHIPDLIIEGKVFVVLSPLFIQGKTYIYPGEEDKLDKNKSFRRIKGLGELKSTDAYNVFFNPDTRRIVQVTMEGSDEAIKMVDKHDPTLRRELMINLGVVAPLAVNQDKGGDLYEETEDDE